MHTDKGQSFDTAPNLILDAKKIFHSAIDAVSPFKLVPLIQQLDLPESCKVVGAGKASMAMAATLDCSFPEYCFEGHVVVPRGYVSSFPEGMRSSQNIKVTEGGHPTPDQGSLQSAMNVIKIANSLGEQDTLIVLLSGGASALWCLPVDGLTLEDKQRVNQELLESGANIHQVNTVRKHLSQIKGGQLAKVAWPAQTITLAISDVIDNDASVIGSGPTVADPTTWRDVADIINKFDIDLPPAVLEYIRVKGQRLETPNPGSPMLKRTSFHLLASNSNAIDGARQMAALLGYDVIEIEQNVSGEARDIGAVKAHQTLELRPGQCFIWGGETTVTIQGKGKGGRNQELALAAACELKHAQNDVVLLSGGTDGIDGPTDAAGGWVTPQTSNIAKSKGIDLYEALADNDAYHSLKAINQLIYTGSTHTNVMDIGVGLRAHE